MAGMGHEGAFRGPKLSARYGFTQGTFAGTQGNGQDGPKPAVSPRWRSPEI